MIVNPDNLLPEANGNHGNSIMKRLFAKCYRVKLANRAHFGKGPVKIVISDGVNVPSVRITPDLCEKITKVSERGITASVNYLKVKLPVEVFLKNCGYCNPIHDVWIKIMEGTSRQLVYLRKVMSANPGSTFTVKATPEFKFTPNSNGSSTVFTIRFEGGFRQSGGNMSIREGSPPMFVRVIFSGFRNYL